MPCVLVTTLLLVSLQSLLFIVEREMQCAVQTRMNSIVDG
jgi:hypothetical protein